MTKPQFLAEYERLCNGFRHQSTPEQGAAWYTKIGHVQAEDWREAVTTLLCAPRFPLLDPVLISCEQAAETRRRMTVNRERYEANRMYAGGYENRMGIHPIEQAYNAFRMDLWIKAKNKDHDPSIFAMGLAEWINVKENAEWATKEPMGDCGKHRGPHTVYQCICDEMEYWILRSNGATAKEANIKVLGHQ